MESTESVKAAYDESPCACREMDSDTEAAIALSLATEQPSPEREPKLLGLDELEQYYAREGCAWESGMTKESILP